MDFGGRENSNLTTSMTLKIGMVSSTEKLGKKHALTKSESEIKISNLV